MLSIQKRSKSRLYSTMLHSLLNTNKMRRMEKWECDRLKEWKYGRVQGWRSEEKWGWKKIHILFICMLTLWNGSKQALKTNSLLAVMVLNLSRVLGLLLFYASYPFALIFVFIYFFMPFSWFVFPWIFFWNQIDLSH